MTGGAPLHFAPEQAFYKRFKKMKHFEYVTTDLNSPIATVKADICNLPFESNSFDTILCNHVLEHILDDTKAMQELFRVMKPGGMGVFQIPQDLKRAITFEDHTITNRKQRTKLLQYTGGSTPNHGPGHAKPTRQLCPRQRARPC
mgnify:CR=1 FL=1